MSVEIFLDPNDYTFTGTFQGEVFKEPSFDAIKRVLKETVAAAVDIPWIPAIKVLRADWTRYSEMSDRWFVPQKQGLAFACARVVLAKRDDGRIIECPWDVEPEKRIVEAVSIKCLKGLDLPQGMDAYGNNARDLERADILFVPYDEPTWIRLCNTAELLIALRTKFDELITTPEGRALIAKTGILSLPHAQKESS